MPSSRQSVLLSTNHLLAFSGSEIVLLEAAEYFQKRNCDVSVFAHVLNPVIRSEFDRLNVSWVKDPTRTSVFDFDFVWAQHRTLPLFDLGKTAKSKKKTLVIGARLSPYEMFEAPGGIVEEGLQDLTIANSEETAEALVRFGIDRAKIRISHNAAPREFFATELPPQKLQRVLVISNHMPVEVSAAMTILRNTFDLEIIHVGLGGQHTRITPEIMRSADVVVTIGKSVQYALMLSIPVYCYDHFAGPGYLTGSVYEDARLRNFSGRGWNEKKSPEAIAHGIIEQFMEARSFVHNLPAIEQQRFDLHGHLDAWTQEAATDTREKMRFVEENMHFLLRERANARLIAREYTKALRTQR